MTETTSDQTSATNALESTGKPAGRVGRHVRRVGRVGLFMVVLLFALALAGAFSVLALTGKPIRLPVWVVAEIEARGNAALASELSSASFAVGGVEFTVDPDWTPRLRVEDLRLLHNGGRTLLALPDVRVVFDPVSLLTEAKLRPKSLRLIGGSVALRRQADGRLDLQLGSGGAMPKIEGLSALLEQVDRALQTPALSRLSLVEAEAATLVLQDVASGRTWSVGDGRLRLDVRPDQLAAEVALTLIDGGEAPAQAVVTLIRPKNEARLRMTASVDQVSSRDIAAQSPILSWLGVVSAPISGRISAEFTDAGLAAMDAEMTLAAGALQPEGAARAIAFDRAGLRLGYDPARGRINLSDLSVESASLRLKASGHSYPLDQDGGILTGPLGRRLPAAFLGQVQISEAQIDPEGLFDRPLIFRQGAIEARLSLDPFRLDIGQISLIEERGRRLSLSGHAAVLPKGWQVALDLGLDAIAHDRLLQLWPKTVVPKTREWIGQNVANGLLTNLRAALRVDPGTEPRLALGYEFDDAEVRFLRTLPPISNGRGRSSIDGRSYLIALDEGEVEAPMGGKIDAAGSVFRVVDVTARPAVAEIRLKTKSTITAALSLLDLPPFGFMSKAGPSPDLGEGLAEVDTFLSLPLQRRVQLDDVDYSVSGVLTNVKSGELIPGKTVLSDSLALQADPSGLKISGDGRVGEARFSVTYRQGFGPEAKGRARVDGTVDLSVAALKEFGVTLPPGMLTGNGKGEIGISLVKGAPPGLSLKTDLAGMGMQIEGIGWALPERGKGALEIEAKLGQPPQVTRLALVAPGLTAEGQLDLDPAGGLKKARFPEVKVGQWLEGAVELVGRGKNRTPDVRMTSGIIDLRRFEAPQGKGAAGTDGGKIDVQLDRLVITEGIALTGFQGSFGLRGGFNGQFLGSVNGAAPVRGEAVPSRNGTAVRITSENAGAVLKAAGVFATAKGGAMDLRLSPRSDRQSYDGRAVFRDVRVRKTSALAELLSAISVVGLLEQLNETGILFSQADFDLVLTSQAVQISDGAATGASLGVSVAGLYGTKTKRLALQGVVSPVYLVNGVGAALTRRGEGLFGFNYAVTGTADEPDVQVNPLSILTPGMFRELFRSPPPVLRKPVE